MKTRRPTRLFTPPYQNRTQPRVSEGQAELREIPVESSTRIYGEPWEGYQVDDDFIFKAVERASNSAFGLGPPDKVISLDTHHTMDLRAAAHVLVGQWFSKYDLISVVTGALQELYSRLKKDETPLPPNVEYYGASGVYMRRNPNGTATENVNHMSPEELEAIVQHRRRTHLELVAKLGGLPEDSEAQ